MNRRALPVTVALVAALAACGGDDDTAADTSGPATTATFSIAGTSVSTGPPTTAARSITAPPTTAAPTTSTIPPIATLTIEHVGDLPGRGVQNAFAVAGTIIAVAHVENLDKTVQNSLLRIDPTTGAVAQEALLNLSSSISDLVFAGDRTVVYGAFQPERGRFECVVRTLDPGSLTLDAGIVIADEFTTGNSCAGWLVADDTTPGVVWHWSPRSLYAYRIDLTAGVAEQVTLPLAADKFPANLHVAAGHAYVTLVPPFGTPERDALQGPYGLLRSNVIRIDAATKQITGPQEVAGEVTVLDGQLVVTGDGQVVQTLEPTTLLPTPADPAQFPPVQLDYMVTADDAAWDAHIRSGTDVLAITQFAPGGHRVIADDEIPIGLDPALSSHWWSTSSAAVGTQLYVFYEAETTNSDGAILYTSRIFRTTAV